MKKIILIAIVLFPILLFGQGQRLGVMPTSVNLSKSSPRGIANSFCADGEARGIPDFTTGRYKYFQSPENIDVKVDGKPFIGGLVSLIKSGDILINTKGEHEVIFALSSKSKYNYISINIKEPNVLSDKPGDYIIEDLWLDKLSELKVLSKEGSTFKNANSYIKEFQIKNEIDPSGLPNEETRELIKYYAEIKGELIKFGYLEEGFKYFDDIIKAESKYVDAINEFREKIKDYENILLKNREYLIFDNKGQIEKWNLDGSYFKKLLDESDIIELENSHFKKVKALNTELNSENIFYSSIGSIDIEAKKVGVLFREDVVEVSLSNADWYEDVFQYLSTLVEGMPDNSTLVLARDDLTIGVERFDKNNFGVPFGDKVLNKSYLKTHEWLNYTELARRLKQKFKNKRFVISSARMSDNFKLKEVPKVRSGEDIIAYMAPKSLNIYADQVASMKSKFKSSSIAVLDIEDKINFQEVKQSNVLILSGHKDLNFENYLKSLAVMGLLEDKIVAIFSCFEQGTTSLNSYMINVGGARQVIFFPSKININATKAVFSEIVDITSNISSSEGKTFEEIISLAVDNAQRNFPEFIQEFELIRNFIPQISIKSQTRKKNG